MIKKLVFFLALLIPLALISQDKSKSTEQFISELDKRIPQLLQDFSVPGAAIAIIENGEIILQKGYGFSDIEKEIRVTTETGFNIASISKTFAAWGIIKLVQDGKIGLNAPASTYLTRWQLPESEFNSNEVTIKRLLSHTAGLSLYGYDGWSPGDTLPTIEESLNGKTNGSGHIEIIMKPGAKYHYSGGGYTILQLIIEEVSGQKFEDYMQKHILDPLGMTNSSFKIDDKIMAASASEYDNFGEKTDFELFTAQAAAGLHTTIEDFTRFAFANLYRNKNQKKDNPVLSADIVQQMMEPVPATNGVYGLGYELYTRKTLKNLIGHTGGNTGWQTMFRVDPTTNDGFIVVTNGGAGYNIINGVFCEWVTWNTGEALWEGCHIKPSIANKLKQIIDDKGIVDIAATYMTLKEDKPDEYNFAENQLNNLGYFYMSRQEHQKAISIFKINIEAFPNSFNVYDSYGEILLTQGAKEQAIENYKESVKLNPGNGNGVKVLNKLGISKDELTKSLSIAVDTKVLAGYVGHFQTATGSTMTIRMYKGLLIAEMPEQELNLVAESSARFHALGDETIITFFTAATGQKGLWARERIWLKIPEPPAGESGSKESVESSPVETHSAGDFLIFRNTPSWKRPTDFENVLIEFGCNYDQRKSSTMADLDLSAYSMIIIPGGQLADFYNDYISNAARFDDYVAKGGTLVLELNWAEKSSIMLPRGVTMASHGALENAILASDHPIFHPLSGKQLIRARYASSGYLQDVPGDARILAVEANGEETLTDRPTFIEYTFGEGQVIAAAQCFHDQDGSGRGPLMESVISYILTKLWAKED